MVSMTRYFKSERLYARISLTISTIGPIPVPFGKGPGIRFTTIGFATFSSIGNIRFGNNLAFAIHANTEKFKPHHLKTNLRVIGNAHPYLHHVFNILEGEPGKIQHFYLTVCSYRLVFISDQQGCDGLFGITC